MTRYIERIFIATACFFLDTVSVTSAAHADKEFTRSVPPPRNGHFESIGRTGLMPTGRLGWHEIGNWRESRRADIGR
jgi:hypothetical protein